MTTHPSASSSLISTWLNISRIGCGLSLFFLLVAFLKSSYYPELWAFSPITSTGVLRQIGIFLFIWGVLYPFCLHKISLSSPLPLHHIFLKKLWFVFLCIAVIYQLSAFSLDLSLLCYIDFLSTVPPFIFLIFFLLLCPFFLQKLRQIRHSTKIKKVWFSGLLLALLTFFPLLLWAGDLSLRWHHEPSEGERIVRQLACKQCHPISPEQLKQNIRARLTYTDVQGKRHLSGDIENWLLLHLYTPQKVQTTYKRTTCPSLPFLFTPTQQPLPSSLNRQGSQAVTSSPQALALIEYLLGGPLSPPQTTPLPTPHLVLSPEEQQRQLGHKIFVQQCATCHGPNGQGDGQNYPPLVQSPYIESPQLLASIISRGVKGPLFLNNKTWDNYMPSLKDQLSSEDIIAVIFHVQQLFSSPPIKSLSLEELHSIQKQDLQLPPLSEEDLKKHLKTSKKEN